MKSEVVLLCNHELIERWFHILEEQRFSVEVSENTPIESFSDLEPVAYRRGTVTDAGALVTVWTNPGQHSQAGTPVAGKYLVILGYNTWGRHRRAANSALAGRITKVLVEAGMTIHPATKEALA